MNQQRHVIKQLILELQLGSQEGAFELQNEVSELYRTKIVPLMDELLSQFSNPDIVHRIETLELDLGTIEIENLERSLIEKTTQYLSQYLEGCGDAGTRGRGDGETGRRGDGEMGRWGDGEIGRWGESRTGKSEFAESLELLTYFIRTGTLPWWAKPLSKQELEKCCQSFLISAPEALLSLLFTPDERPLKRIIYQFSDRILLQIGQILAPNLSSSFAQGYGKLGKKNWDAGTGQREISFTLTPQQYRLEYWRGLLYSLLARQNLPLDEQQIRQEVQLHLASYQKRVGETTKQTRRRGDTETRRMEIPPKISLTLQQELELSPSNNPLRESSGRFSQAEEIYVPNAGLVIIWPFLERFYQTLGLVEGKSFNNLESGERAVLILQYLVDGSIDIPESNLPLNKILCGFDPFEPIPTAFEPTESEKAECQTLLSAIIQHWSSLKNTSIPGFQQLFLERKGILRVRDGCWLLQLEQAPQDVLLDTIPWSIRVVKLPWMEEIVYVE
ncbi:MAG: hypothetical protein F6K21_24500 [Symploca sp. SIO2D2]|nr:hypothetical protein [Symploca sp. SIO2D2]